MCGIAGTLFRRKNVDQDKLSVVIKGMADRLSHRGPDADGIWVNSEDGLALGHRRLSIIDLSTAGTQPMHSANGRFVIAYNGEIYNFTEIRKKLSDSAYPFRGHSDTEVLLAAIQTWGIKAALEDVHGMFAFALWDTQRRTLTLARDRVGKKPLYYGWCGDAFMFASELKALATHPNFDAEIDSSALTELIEFGWISEPLSIFRCVRKLQPGSFIALSAESEPWQVPSQRYWTSGQVMTQAREDIFSGSLDQAADRLNELLTQAVSERMIADVDIGALLSGGVDSSTVVGMMQTLSDRPVKTFSIGFREKKYNEAEYAAAVARHLGTEHHEMIFQASDCLGLIEKMPLVYDEPFADVSQLPTFLIAQVAAKHVKVVLSGDGGDELFAGYSHYRESAALWHRLRHIPMPLRRGVVDILGHVESTAWRLSNCDRASQRGGYKLTRRFSKVSHKSREWAAGSIQDVLAKHFSKTTHASKFVPGATGSISNMHDRDQQLSGLDDIAALRHFDYIGYLAGDLLVKLDRATMANSLEARCPILDHRVVGFAWSLPDKHLFDEAGGKRVLRKVLQRYVPDKFTNRPKRGFGVPMDDWLRNDLREWSEELLGEESLLSSACFDVSNVRRLWEQHLCEWKDNSKLLWAILMFQSWWRSS